VDKIRIGPKIHTSKTNQYFEIALLNTELSERYKLPFNLARYRGVKPENPLRCDGGSLPASEVTSGADPRLGGQPRPPLSADQPHPLLRGHHLLCPQVYVSECFFVDFLAPGLGYYQLVSAFCRRPNSVFGLVDCCESLSEPISFHRDNRLFHIEHIAGSVGLVVEILPEQRAYWFSVKDFSLSRKFLKM
jgi:hypothetical protein